MNQNTEKKINPREDLYEFEVFLINTSEKTNITNQTNLVSAISSNGKLWGDHEIVNNSIKFEGGSCKAISIENSEDVESNKNKFYSVSLSGNLLKIENKRIPLVRHLKELKFDLIYVTKDSVSKHIGEKLYPLLYEVESSLRGYITKSMSVKYRPNWWKDTAEDKLKSKASGRKENESFLTDELIENEVYLIDFTDLGEIIYKKTSGVPDEKALRKEIEELKETEEAVKELKKKLQTNYIKFFKKNFKDKGFDDKWIKLSKLRNKIAHNSLFDYSELLDGQKLHAELVGIIEHANKDLPNIDITEQDLANIQSNVQEIRKYITENDFLEKLQNREEYFSSRENGFVGVQNFITKHLAGKGFDIRNSSEILEILVEKGEIEKYNEKNPYSKYPVAAIKISRKNL